MRNVSSVNSMLTLIRCYIWIPIDCIFFPLSAYKIADRCGKYTPESVKKGVGVMRRGSIGAFVPPVRASVYVQSESM